MEKIIGNEKHAGKVRKNCSFSQWEIKEITSMIFKKRITINHEPIWTIWTILFTYSVHLKQTKNRQQFSAAYIGKKN